MTKPATEPKDLPPGTSPEHEKLHRNIRRVCYVLLFGLVIEGALTFPLLAIWYGWPTLSAKQVCSELQKVMYSDQKRECQQPVPLGRAPFGGKAEAEGQTTAKDQWGIQPKPLYPAIGFRDLVKNHEKCAAEQKGDTSSGDTTSGGSTSGGATGPSGASGTPAPSSATSNGCSDGG
jgi:hypothetical protein